ncbi:glycosyltransferase family 4 protein [Pedobacter immunditicola]|uniref:glycosyltransferase family 4 protein n=1 Tax=Pedobacter immunditicola TaxID=3133440 RepID=UPI0030ADA050
MKLAIISTHPVQYAAPVFQLLAKRVELKVFYTEGLGNTYDKEFQRKIQWDIPLLSGYNYEWIVGRTRIEQISRYQPQCLFIYGWASKGHLQLLRHFKNKTKIVFSGDSTLLKKLPWWKDKLKEFALTWVYQHVNYAVYAGTHNKAYFLKYGLQEKQLTFAPHAIDNDRFSFQQPTPSNLRAELGLLQTDTLVLFAGKFNDNKNVLGLLRAFIEISMKNAHLLFVGNGILEQQLKQEAMQHKNIHFLPFQNQLAMPGIYQVCDLFCLPSKNESWGLSINEAMACGKAVLVSDQCGAAVDLVTTGNGVIFKSNEPEDLKRQLNYLLRQPLFLKEAGKHSFEIIRHWNFNVQVENIITCLYA